MPHPTIPEDSPPAPANHSSDLRLRRRIRTKQLVQAEALRLFTSRGYDQTTVDDIAHAAAMSPRTFFRYFATKEDVVLWDEYDEHPLQELWQVRPGQDALTQLLVLIRETLADLYRKDPELLLTRIRLAFDVPEIRARFFDQQMILIAPYFRQIMKAVGAHPDDLRLPVMLAAVFSAMLVAVERWQRHDGREDLLDLFDDAIAALAAGASDLRDTVQAAPAGADGPRSAPARRRRPS
jgi:AcrR family transcriptional regulator